MGKFNENSKLKELLLDPRACEIIESYLPGILKHPGLKIAKMINPSIKQAISYRKQVSLSSEQAQEFVDRLYALE